MNARVIVIILTIVFPLFLFGCKNAEQMIVQEEDVASEQLISPPELTVAVGERTIKPVRGTYSWIYRNEDGTLTAVEASSLSPTLIVENHIPIEVSPNSELSLNFEIPPINYQVRIWDTNEDIIGTYKELDLKQYTGKVINEILATWEQGTVSYAFSLHVLEATA